MKIGLKHPKGSLRVSVAIFSPLLSNLNNSCSIVTRQNCMISVFERGHLENCYERLNSDAHDLSHQHRTCNCTNKNSLSYENTYA